MCLTLLRVIIVVLLLKLCWARYPIKYKYTHLLTSSFALQSVREHSIRLSPLFLSHNQFIELPFEGLWGLTCVCSSVLCSPQPVHFVCLFIQTCIVVHWKPLNFQWFSSFCPKSGNRKKHSLNRTDNKGTFWNVVMDQLCCWSRALEGKQGRGLPEV